VPAIGRRRVTRRGRRGSTTEAALAATPGLRPRARSWRRSRAGSGPLWSSLVVVDWRAPAVERGDGQGRVVKGRELAVGSTGGWLLRRATGTRLQALARPSSCHPPTGVSWTLTYEGDFVARGIAMTLCGLTRRRRKRHRPVGTWPARPMTRPRPTTAAPRSAQPAEPRPRPSSSACLPPPTHLASHPPAHQKS
jgi:hypothetical protein